MGLKNPELDFTSDSFNPLKALYSNFNLPFPKAKTYNNIAEYYVRTFEQKQLNANKSAVSNSKENEFVLKRNYAWYFATLGLDYYEDEETTIGYSKKRRYSYVSRARKRNCSKPYELHKSDSDSNFQSCPPLRSSKIVVSKTFKGKKCNKYISNGKSYSGNNPKKHDDHEIPKNLVDLSEPDLLIDYIPKTASNNDKNSKVVQSYDEEKCTELKKPCEVVSSKKQDSKSCKIPAGDLYFPQTKNINSESKSSTGQQISTNVPHTKNMQESKTEACLKSDLLGKKAQLNTKSNKCSAKVNKLSNKSGKLNKKTNAVSSSIESSNCKALAINKKQSVKVGKKAVNIDSMENVNPLFKDYGIVTDFSKMRAYKIPRKRKVFSEISN